MVSVVIHSNPSLANQIESAGWLKEGFTRHGIDAEITRDKYRGADVHVVQGPWYAYNEWLGKPNVLFLNRCFFGDSRFDLSIGWLQPDGSRDFRNHGMAAPNGTVPTLKPKKESRRCAVVFGDYGEDAGEKVRLARKRYSSVFFRPHPAQTKEDHPVMKLRGDLAGVFSLADVAIGGSSTVLVDAEIEGLHVESSDPLHVCQGITSREQWLTDLSWAQWNHDQIKAGEFWEHLC